MSELPKSAQKVQHHADALNLAITVKQMPSSTRTAQEAAEACQCSIGQIVKSLIFRGSNSSDPYLLLVSGSNRVNEKRMAHELGEKLERPDAGYVRQVTGYAIGGVPPFGHDQPLKTFIDQDLLQYEVVWAAAGTPNCLFASSPHALCEALSATMIDVT